MPDEVRIAQDLAPGGVLRASINLGNPVLAQGTADDPHGVTVDLAREIAARLDLPVELLCFVAARKSFEAMRDGLADLCFLAIEPAREAEVAFTAPYVVIEGVYVVPAASPLEQADDVDRPGIQVGVKEGSAYDLYLTRTLSHATIVRDPTAGVDVYLAESLDVAAGIRQPLAAFVAGNEGHHMLPGAFMQIRQAVGIPKHRHPDTLAWIRAAVEDLKVNGFVTTALTRSGQPADVLAPPA